MFDKNILTEVIANKIANKENLNSEEQDILKQEFKIAKSRIFLSRLSVFLIILVEIIFFVYISYRVSMSLEFFGGNESSKPKKDHIAVINIDKPLTDEYADKMIGELLSVSKKENVKTIVLRLRSPGGTPSSAWNITSTMKKIQKTKSLYVYVDSAAVSGSYMIASQADKIYSNPFAMIGSIGVIMEHLVVEDLANKVGIGQETLTAGKYKKTLSTFNYLNEEDRTLLENNLLKEVYNNFKRIVAEGRHISVEQLEEFAEGKVFVASDPRLKGILVDEVLDWTEMKDLIIEKDKLNKEIEFINYEKPKKDNFLKEVLGTIVSLNSEINNSLPILK